MSRRIKVGIAEYCIAESPNILVAFGLGSCVGISLYDPGLKLGGLAHIMLPVNNGSSGSNPKKFADSAVELMLEEMLKKGCKKKRILAKICGGANMFHSLSSSQKRIGEKNTDSVRRKLKQLQIPLVSQDIGGSYGRTVEFMTSSGELVIKTIRRELRVI